MVSVSLCRNRGWQLLEVDTRYSCMTARLASRNAPSTASPSTGTSRR
jgi:hypothetical protein